MKYLWTRDIKNIVIYVSVWTDEGLDETFLDDSRDITNIYVSDYSQKCQESLFIIFMNGFHVFDDYATDNGSVVVMS